MAVIDGLLEFSDAQALTATAVSTNVIDLGSDRDVGPGQTMYVVLTVDVAAGGTSPTFDVDVQTDDNEAFSSATVIASFPQITSTTGVAGAQFYLTIPQENERYLRLNYTAGGTSPTITVSARVTDQHPYTWKAYPDAVN